MDTQHRCFLTFIWSAFILNTARKDWRKKRSYFIHYPLCASAILARKRRDRSKVRLAKSMASKIRYLLTFVRGRREGFRFGLQISSHVLPHSRGRRPVKNKHREKGLMLERGQQEEDMGGGEAHKYTGRRAGVTDKCDLLGLHPTQRWQVSLLGWYYPAITRTDGPL